MKPKLTSKQRDWIIREYGNYLDLMDDPNEYLRLEKLREILNANTEERTNYERHDISCQCGKCGTGMVVIKDTANTEERVAHSKSEYRRLKAQGVDVQPPNTPCPDRYQIAREVWEEMFEDCRKWGESIDFVFALDWLDQQEEE